MKKRETLNDKLGLDPVEEGQIELDDINVVSKGSKADLKEDYEKLRESLIGTLIRSQEAIDQVTREIKQGGTAMMVQSLAQLLKGVGDTTKALLELHKETRKLDEKKVEEKVNEKKTIKTNLNDIIELAKEREKRSNG